MASYGVRDRQRQQEFWRLAGNIGRGIAERRLVSARLRAQPAEKEQLILHVCYASSTGREKPLKKLPGHHVPKLNPLNPQSAPEVS